MSGAPDAACLARTHTPRARLAPVCVAALSASLGCDGCAAASAKEIGAAGRALRARTRGGGNEAAGHRVSAALHCCSISSTGGFKVLRLSSQGLEPLCPAASASVLELPRALDSLT